MTEAAVLSIRIPIIFNLVSGFNNSVNGGGIILQQPGDKVWKEMRNK